MCELPFRICSLPRLQSRPHECVAEVGEWVKSERETRERLKKEKEEVRRHILPHAP